MIVIDEEKCIGCGLCVQDCPEEKIVIRNGKAYHKAECIQCGHCVAVCPGYAVSIPEYDMDQVEEYDPEAYRPGPDVLLKAIKSRRSIRNFRQEKIERIHMENILEAGRYTPTAHNTQGCRFIVVQDELEELKKQIWDRLPDMAEKLKKSRPRYAAFLKYLCRKHDRAPFSDQLFFNAPAVILITSEYPLDGGLAAANMESVAVSEGVGILYCGFLAGIIDQCPEIKEWLSIKDQSLACCMLAGYPAVKYRRTAPRKSVCAVWK